MLHHKLLFYSLFSGAAGVGGVGLQISFSGGKYTLRNTRNSIPDFPRPLFSLTQLSPTVKLDTLYSVLRKLFFTMSMIT